MAALTPEIILWVTRANSLLSEALLRAMGTKVSEILFWFAFFKIKKVAPFKRLPPHPHPDASQSEGNGRAILSQGASPSCLGCCCQEMEQGLCNWLACGSEAKQPPDRLEGKGRGRIFHFHSKEASLLPAGKALESSREGTAVIT